MSQPLQWINTTLVRGLVEMQTNTVLSYCRYNELTIHGLGAAINRAINLALKLQESSPYELRVRVLINAHYIY